MVNCREVLAQDKDEEAGEADESDDGEKEAVDDDDADEDEDEDEEDAEVQESFEGNGTDICRQEVSAEKEARRLIGSLWGN